MSTIDIPASTIKPQRQTETATDNYPSVLMDDTNYIMDDTRAFMGNQTRNSSSTPTNATINDAPSSSISPHF